jgi:DNA repair protein RadC
MGYIAPMKIKDMCGSERPREKLILKGASSLSDGELLAILLRTGTKGRSVLDIGQELLARAGGRLSTLFAMQTSQLCEVSGIKNDKAATLMAAIELGRRFLSEASTILKQPVVSARMVYDEMLPRLKAVGHEEMWVIFLSSSLYRMGRERLSVGSISSAPVDVRKIVRLVLDRNAKGIILVHNHPGANPRPSKADIQRTDDLRKVLRTFEIDLVDHVIVTDDAFFSFADDRCYNA